MVTNSDGSLAIVAASPAHLPGAVLASDGSVTLAPDTDVVINQDGSVTVAGATLPPGTQVQRTEDGGLVVRPPAPATSLPPGTQVLEAADGTRTVNGAPLPPGAELTQNGDGSYTVTLSGAGAGAGATLPQVQGHGASGVPGPGTVTALPKDTPITRAADGSLVVGGVTMPPGSSVEVGGDGSVVLTTATTTAATALQTSPGQAGLQQVLSLPGCQATTEGGLLLAKGTVVAHNPDGSLSVGGCPLPPGTLVTTLPDGRVTLAPPGPPTLQKQADGSLVLGATKLPRGAAQNVDGSVTLPANTKVSLNPDGSVNVDGKKLPPGTNLVENADGSFSIVGNQQTQNNTKVNNDGTLSLGDVKLPKGSSGNLDGSISLPKGSKIIQNADGTIHLNGKQLPPGLQAVTSKDGSVALVPLPAVCPPAASAASAAGLLVGNVRLPAGSVANNDGSISLPAEAAVTKQADGSLVFEGKTFPPGSRLVVNTDGTKSVVLPSSVANGGGGLAGFVFA